MVRLWWQPVGQTVLSGIQWRRKTELKEDVWWLVQRNNGGRSGRRTWSSLRGKIASEVLKPRHTSKTRESLVGYL